VASFLLSCSVIHTHQVAEFFVSLKFGNDIVGLRKTLTLSAETILYVSAGITFWRLGYFDGWFL